MLDVYFYEAFREEERWLRSLLPATIRAGFTWKTIQEADDGMPPAGLISIRTQSIVPGAWGRALGGVLSRSTGYDHLAQYRSGHRSKSATGAGTAAATDLAGTGTAERGPALGYLPLYCHRAVAEQAMLLWMALLRRLPQQIAQFRSFTRDGLTGRECAGKTLVVVGVGNVGSEVVRIGTGLGMNVIGVDPVHRHDFVRYESAEVALPGAGVIVCSMNLTADNVGYFDLERLSTAPRGVFFVNVARGEMSPPGVLLTLLEAEQLGGVGLDVHDHESDLAVALRSMHPGRDGAGGEPAGSGSAKSRAEGLTEATRQTLELARHPQVILTPHNAFNTEEAVERKAAQTIAQVERFLRAGDFLWPVPPA
ncbi:MAG: NAD(P)-dependent oxidoreductase [Candidatus Eisenbacteria bacterium]